MHLHSLPRCTTPEKTTRIAENGFLKNVTAIVEQHYDDPAFGIQNLAKTLRLSPSQIYRKIKALTERSPAIYLRSLRLLKARDLLLFTDLTITEITYKTGFSELSYFSHTFSVEFGVCPSAFRKCINN